ncbi:hypothetical protein CJJ23_02850 [Mycoplasmopsis agassizii]|uniref:pullulanase n=1 Tax=Mycoplasmopsis agassizii TaxID=33922 RepID=A0A269TIE9_9BACT|nr:pullulanase-associated domain-containing protein [Mycoplasmopsis agassizii]PAK21262.1 hypothetical protein CJJ23_02850 [Mycoplasmopsis agassizii]
MRKNPKIKKSLFLLTGATFIASVTSLIACSPNNSGELSEQAKLDKESEKIKTEITLSVLFNDWQPQEISFIRDIEKLLDFKNYNSDNSDVLTKALNNGYSLSIESFTPNKSENSDSIDLIFLLKSENLTKKIASTIKGFAKNEIEKPLIKQAISDVEINKINKIITAKDDNTYRPKDILSTLGILKLLNKNTLNNEGKNGAIFKEKLSEGLNFKVKAFTKNLENNKTELEFIITLYGETFIEKDLTLKIIKLKANTDSEVIPSKKLVIHYKPSSNTKIKGWGLHLWNNDGSNKAIETETSWQNPILFSEVADENGFYKAEVDIINLAKGLNYILHNGDEKDGGDRSLPLSADYSEFWILANSETVYSDLPVASIDAKYALRVNPERILIEFNNDLKILRSAITIKNLNNQTFIDRFRLKQNKELVTLEFMDMPPRVSDKLMIRYNNEDLVLTIVSKPYINDSKMHYEGTLGANLLSNNSWEVKLYAPTSSKAEIILFDKDQKEIKRLKMTKEDNDLVFAINLDKANTNLESLDGLFYQFILDNNRVVLDPYAKSMASFNPAAEDKVGKAAFVDLTSEKAGVKPKALGVDIESLKGNVNKMVAYEIHVRDFTINSDVADKGTFKGFANWDKGIKHLQDLGITHVQLMPIQNYYTVDENNKTYNDNQVDSKANYNWGYDPHNYFSIEGWLASDANDPYARIKEFRELVNKLHKNNIGVIVDVVYNHLFKNSILEDIVENLYFRFKGKSTPVGEPAVASESFMMQRLILESLKFFHEEMGVDGFRFDLLGFIDSTTILKARELMPKAILYGEAWNFTDLDSGLSPVKGVASFNEHKVKDLAYFNDAMRRSSKGDTGEGQAFDLGYLNGNNQNAGLLRAALIGGIKNFKQSEEKDGLLFSQIDNSENNLFADTATESLNYLAIHDGFSLWDKINLATAKLADKSDSENIQYKINLLKQAYTLLFTSQGRIVIQGGDEMGRTKPLAKNDANLHRSATSDNLIVLDDVKDAYENKYAENSYHSSDYTNSIRWNRLEDTFANGEFKKLKDYVKGLITLRKSFASFSLTKVEDINQHLTFFGETKTNSASLYKNFLDPKLGELKIKFINADQNARNKKWYLAGEISTSANNQNLTKFVEIDQDGNGTLILNKNDLELIHKNRAQWGESNSFNFKLVSENDSWASPSKAYEGLGNSSIPLASINESKEAIIDLAKTNFQATRNNQVNENKAVDIIQYHLTNIDPKSNILEVIVASNPSDQDIELAKALDASWAVIVDNNSAGITKIDGYDFSKNKAMIKSKATMVFAKFK